LGIERKEIRQTTSEAFLVCFNIGGSGRDLIAPTSRAVACPLPMIAASLERAFRIDKAPFHLVGRARLFWDPVAHLRFAGRGGPPRQADWEYSSFGLFGFGFEKRGTGGPCRKGRAGAPGLQSEMSQFSALDGSFGTMPKAGPCEEVFVGGPQGRPALADFSGWRQTKHRDVAFWPPIVAGDEDNVSAICPERNAVGMERPAF